MPLNFLAKAAISVAMSGLQMAIGASKTIEGPRLDDLSFTNGDYGASVMRFWAKRRQSPPIFWAEDLKEVKRRRKTKGGKYNEYTYFGSWAVMVACHEIEAVLRIWADNKLVFDLTGVGPVSPFDFGETGGGGKSGSNALGFGAFAINEHITIYFGTEDQEPDPRILAWTEAKWGEGSCSAHRGMAYVVFKDFPLEKFGNRIPQISLEAVSKSAPHYPYETFDTIIAQPAHLNGFTFSPDFSRFMFNSGTIFEMWDTRARTRMFNGTFDPPVVGSLRTLGLYDDGTVLATGDGLGVNLYRFNPDGGGGEVIYSFRDHLFDHGYQAEVRVLKDGAGVEHWLTIPYSIIHYFYVDGAEYRMDALTGVDWQVCDYVADADGGIWAVGRTVGAGADTVYFQRLIGTGAGPTFFSVPMASLSSSFADLAVAWHAGAFVLCWGFSSLYRIDPADGTILASRTGMSIDGTNAVQQFRSLRAEANSIWLNAAEIDLSDLSTIRTIDIADWLVQDADGMIYDPVNHALICAPQYLQVITFRYLDRVGSSGVELRQVIEDINAVAKGDPNDIYAAACTQTLPGYSVTGGSGKDWLASLLDLYDIDPRPHGFQLEFVPRGGAPGAELSCAAFALPDGGGEHGDGGNTYSFPRSGGTDVPVTMQLNFADTNADQEPNFAMSGPIAGSEGARITTLNMPTLALDGDTARRLLARYHRRRLMERVPYSFALSVREAALEAADVHPVALREVTEIMRCAKAALGADGRIATEWLRDDPSIALLDGSTGATYDGHKPSVVLVPLISRPFVLDLPLLSDIDQDANPVLYVAAAPFSDGFFPGAVVYEAQGGDYADAIATVDSGSRATWGYATDALGAVTSHRVWDRGRSVNIKLQVGTLAGCTEADINADPRQNMFALRSGARWEIGNFTTATLETDGSHTLSGLKRARCGTEGAVAGHAVGDVFVLLDTATPVQMGLSEVGLDLAFKAITNGRTEAGALPATLEPFTGASLKPWAPCRLVAVKNPTTGDWALSWVRRTRIGGAWIGGTPIPLSEVRELYHVVLGDGSGSVTKVLDAGTYAWSVAQQVADLGAEVMAGDLAVTVYQISDAVGRGFPADLAA